MATESCPTSHFAATYAAARALFLERAATAGAAPRSYRHPLRGHDGEELAVDVAHVGPAAAPRALLVSSGCHGVEGFCGSGIQCALLADREVLAAAAAAGIAIVFVHGLNPWGFSAWRRVTEENVDLNRNVVDFTRPLPANPAYDNLASALVPRRWPAPLASLALLAFAARHGRRALQQALSGGQSQHPDGLFYSGRAPTWSQQVLRDVIRTAGDACERLAWIDLHSGLGPRGRGEAILACDGDGASFARARAWWGDVRDVADGNSISARVDGPIWRIARQECPRAEYTGIVLEFGTLPAWQVLGALRADQWLATYGRQANAAKRARIRARMRAAFFDERPDWQAAVLGQARRAVLAAVRGLAV